VNISQYQFPVLEFGSKTPVIFILDATWPCAKSMMRESSCLHSLPRISFDPKVKSRFSIKHQPADYCLSTIESVYEVLCLLENQSLEQIGEQKNTLITALKKLVDYQIMCAKDPSRSNYRRQNKTFSIQSQRVQSKKWKKRKICFEGKPKQSLP
jgi:DTW domain-containing protein YfiP